MILPRTCCASCRGHGHTTSGKSLFEAAARAIEWWEQDCKHFGTAMILKDHEIVEMALVGDERNFRVKVGRIRQWLREEAGQ